MLDQADIDAIAKAVKGGGPMQGAHEGGDDEEKDANLIDRLVGPKFHEVSDALIILADAVCELKDRLDNIDQEFGGFTSGLHGIIDKRKRGEFVGSLREKFPDFARFEGLVKDLADVDLYEDLGNDLYEYKNSPDYTDEGLEGKAKEMLGNLSGKFGPILEALEKVKPSAAAPSAEKTVGEEKPVSAVEVEVKKSDVDPKLEKYLKSSKGR